VLHRLDVPFQDATAAQLTWSLDEPPQPALATLDVGLPRPVGLRLELRLLGASHQVLVRDPADGRVRCNELVACRPGQAGGRLPGAVVRHLDARLAYRFAYEVRRVDAAVLAHEAEQLLADHEAPARRLVGAFPGDRHAVTAIHATDDGWRTWHLYPQAGEIVTTRTVLA
jgi:hypothetical protein